MALVATLAGSNNSTLNQDTYVTAGTSINAAVGDVIVAAVTASDSVTSIPDPTISSGAISWIKRDEQLPVGATAYSCTLLTGVVTSTITSGQMTFDFTGDTATGCGAEVFVVSGGGTFRQFKFQTFAAGGTPTFSSLETLLTTSSYICVVWNTSNPAALTVPTDWATEDRDVGHNNPTMGVHACHRDQGETGTSITYGGTSVSGGFGYFVEIAQYAVNENGSATDTVTAANTTSAAVSEAGAGADTQTAVATFVATVSETGTATDTVDAVVAGGGVTHEADLTETGSATDTITAVVVFVALVDETSAATDTLTAANTTSAEVTETGAANDNQDATVTPEPSGDAPFRHIYRRRNNRIRARRAA